MIFKSICDDVFKPELHQYTAESESVDVTEVFTEMLEAVVTRIWTTVDFDKDFDKETSEEYFKATHCWICKKELDGDKVLDHCHFTGKYRGAAHKACNLSLKMPNFMPMFCHNLSGYDTHLFFRALAAKPGWVTCIPTSFEKFISISKKITVYTYIYKAGKRKDKVVEIRFLDSIRFMQDSLANLVSNVPPESFEILKNILSQTKTIQIITSKWCIPLRLL